MMKFSAASGEQRVPPHAAVAVEHMVGEGLDITRAYDENAAFIGRVIQRLLGAGRDVDDVLQETFIVAMKKRHEFDPARASLATWLYGIASNLCMRRRRSSGRLSRFRERLARDPTTDTCVQPHCRLEREQQIKLVQRQIARLPFKQREVFVLYELEEMPGKEIATLLDIPLGTVWTRLHTARRVFRANVEKHIAHDEVAR